MKTRTVFFAISFLLPQLVVLAASDNDTVWLESPRESNKRDYNRRKRNDCIQYQKDLEDAALRIRQARLLSQSAYLTSLNEIIDGLLPEKIIITKETKSDYLAELKKRYKHTQELYDEASQAIELSYYLQKLAPFYIRDR